MRSVHIVTEYNQSKDKHMSFLSQLDWRFATKKFDVTKKVSDGTLDRILAATRMAPTSFGLQPFRVMVVTDAEVRAKISVAAWSQPQVMEGSHLLVFTARTDVAARAAEYVELSSGGDAAAKEKLAGLTDMLEGFAAKLDEAGALSWASKQAYIALGFAMAAAAELEVDSGPMEGFDTAAVDTILDLPEHFRSVVMLSVGYRAEGPASPKVRFPDSDLFSWI